MTRLKSIWEGFKVACALTVIVCLPTGIFHAFVVAYCSDVTFWKMVVVIYGAALIVATVAAITIEQGKRQ